MPGPPEPDAAPEPVPVPVPVPHARARQNRQARVGILYNPNDPPCPPPHRAQLTGRWPALRSSRRPSEEQVQRALDALAASGPAALAPGPEAEASRRAAEEARRDMATLCGIDMKALEAFAEALGEEEGAAKPPVRAPFAEEMRADRDAAGMAAVPPPPAVLTAAAWLDDPAAGPADSPPPAPGARHLLPRRIALGVLVLALLLLALRLVSMRGFL